MTLKTDSNDQLSTLLTRFWEQEEIKIPTPKSLEDEECERIFINGCQRNNSGRYIVRLPTRPDLLSKLGESLPKAKRMIQSLENRLESDETSKVDYCKFMSEYETLGHMRPLSTSGSQGSTKNICYIPHHAVWREADGKRKVRVVFNASAKTSTGVTLNQALYTGPKLQNDLDVILTRWRFFRIAFCADIEMMYRQILVDERDINLQRILWQNPGKQEDQHYQLLTLTYGMSCSPYLAIRTLHQLAKDEGHNYPKAAKILLNNAYVDDILAGEHDQTSALLLRNELTNLLKSGGMHLKKWAFNCSFLLNDIKESDRLRPNWLDFKSDNPVNTLGIAWDPASDEFRFRAPTIDLGTVITKRKVLGAIAKLFDPVGWLSPITIMAKIFMQDLWKEKLDWDTPLSKQLLERWLNLQTGFSDIENIHIPRWIGFHPGNTVEIHGFGDASKHAFAAAIYLRIQLPQGQYHTQLLTAKTRVAPVKIITIPRLELCAALLTIKLTNYILQKLDIPVTAVYAWSDSLNTLSWIQTENPSQWPVYIANRVSEIQRKLPDVTWRYVPGKNNLADIATRGINAHSLAKLNLWWQGPGWLSQDSAFWPPLPSSPLQGPVKSFTIPPSVRVLYLQQGNAIIDRFSLLTRLIRVIARCLLFKLLLKPISERRELIRQRLTVDEMNKAFLACVLLSQKCDFNTELELLQEEKKLPKRHHLEKLSPFLDSKGVLRVGGRLANSPLPYDERHPVILYGNSSLAQLIIDWAHRTAMHGGFQLTFSYAAKRAWIIRGLVKVKAHIRRCLICARYRAQTSKQLMGNLPPERVTISFLFEKTGVDYAGPFAVKRTTGRGARTTKGYIALFVCLSSKAVHLEAVGDLTTQSFLGALRRLTGRRGTPSEIWSDNATTFHGADAELRAMLRAAEIDWNLVEDTLAVQGIKWKFIPPSAPHHGGLWEANIKSAKSLMKKVIGTRPLTYEELTTLVVEIEACMNSRPLLPITGEPEDVNALTPSHALIGKALHSFPEALSATTNVDHLTRWLLVKALRDNFLMRWSREYINTLQQRKKWTVKHSNLQINDLVLVIDPSLIRTGRWPLGRITTVYPDRHGLVRSVSVRTTLGTYTRPITKVCLLPKPR